MGSEFVLTTVLAVCTLITASLGLWVEYYARKLKRRLRFTETQVQALAAKLEYITQTAQSSK